MVAGAIAFTQMLVQLSQPDEDLIPREFKVFLTSAKPTEVRKKLNSTSSILDS